MAFSFPRLFMNLAIMWTSIPLLWFGCVKRTDKAKESLGGLLLWLLCFFATMAFILGAIMWVNL